MATQFIDTATPTIGLKAGADIINNNGVESAYQGSYFASGGTANAITLTSSGGEAPSNYVVGHKMRFRVSSTNTGATTVSVDGLPITALKTLEGNDLPASYLPTDREIEIVYDGVNFKVYPPVGTAAAQIPTNETVNAKKRKNYIVNPSMAISQENGDGPNTYIDGYPADQWRAINNTATGTLTGEIGELEGLKSVKLTATSAITDLTGTNVVALIQQIEAQNVYVLNETIVCFQLKTRTNWSGNLSISVVNNNATRSYVTTVPVTSGVNFNFIVLALEASTIDAIDNGIGFRVYLAGCNEGTRQTATENSWQSGNLYASTSSTQWAKTAGNFVEITAVKLEEGTTPTAFEPNSYAQDLAECQRYARLIELEGKAVGYQYGSAGGAQMYAGSLSFSNMRDVPVVSEIQAPTYENCSFNSLVPTENSVLLRVNVGSTGSYRANNGTYFLNARL